MERWEREDLIQEHSKLSEKMMEHYDHCSQCCTDAMEQRGITCEVMKDFLSKCAAIRTQLGDNSVIR